MAGETVILAYDITTTPPTPHLIVCDATGRIIVGGVGPFDLGFIRGVAPTVPGFLDILAADGSIIALGALGDPVVAAGAAGSISAKFRRATQGLEDLKTLIQLADGNIITLGAIADLMVAAGAAGTVSAKLRRLTQGVEDLKTAGPMGTGTVTATTHAAVNVNGDTLVLAANANRKYAAFLNDDADTPIYLEYDGAAAVAHTGIRLNPAGGSFQLSQLYGNLTAVAVRANHAGGAVNKVLLVTESI